MASNLRSIQDAVANLSVSYTNEAGGSVTPTAKDINQMPSSVPAADVPIRLMGPISEGGNTDSFVFDAVGANVEYTHTVTELALIANAGLSQISVQLPDQVRYSDAIQSALVSNRGIYTNCDITDGNATRKVTEFPPGSGEWWYSVLTEITVRELA